MVQTAISKIITRLKNSNHSLFGLKNRGQRMDGKPLKKHSEAEPVKMVNPGTDNAKVLKLDEYAEHTGRDLESVRTEANWYDWRAKRGEYAKYADNNTLGTRLREGYLQHGLIGLPMIFFYTSNIGVLILFAAAFALNYNRWKSMGEDAVSTTKRRISKIT